MNLSSAAFDYFISGKIIKFILRVLLLIVAVCLFLIFYVWVLLRWPHQAIKLEQVIRRLPGHLHCFVIECLAALLYRISINDALFLD